MKEIMKKYSTTFFKSMETWPTEIKEDIYKLYAYLRLCDEIVEGEDYFNTEIKIKVTEQFNEVVDKYEIEQEWVDEFHHAMMTDLRKKEHSITAMLEYCKGSSESVGLMMARILGCPPEADEHAKALGRAYQIINFIRDYDEDVAKGYHYISERHELYLKMFYEELDKGMEGLRYIPDHLKEPIVSASAMFLEVADDVEKYL